MPFFGPPNILKLSSNRDIKGLINALDFPDDSIRTLAVDALGVIGPDAIKLLHQALRSQSINIRCGAARSLAKIHNPLAIPALEEGLRSPIQSIRIDCASGLGKVKDISAILILRTHYKLEKSQEVQLAVLEALALLGDTGAIDTIFSLLESDDHNIRIMASTSLSRLGQPVQEHLIHGLQNEKPAVRYACANALSVNRTTNAVIPLIQTLADEDEGVQKAAQEALCHYDLIAAQYLTKALNTSNQKLKQMVIRTLERMAGVAEGPLLSQLSNPESKATEIIIQILGKVGGEKSITPLSNLVRVSDPSLRYAAVESLAMIGLDDAISPLINALVDQNDYIAQAAIKGLRGIARKTKNPKIARRINIALQEQSMGMTTASTHQERINSLMKELLAISQSDGFIGDGGAQFDSLSRQLRAREIGMILYDLGGHRLMQTVWGTLSKQLDSKLSADLMTNWKEIGGWNAK